MAMGWWMALHMNKNVCNAKMASTVEQDVAEQVVLKRRVPREIRCELMPGHPGNHLARTKTCTYQWRNELATP
jgi:hypothetical protein